MNTIVPEQQANPFPPSDAEFVFESTAQKQSARLSQRSLTVMLVLMCLIPIVTISILWAVLPSVEEGKLEANVYAEGLPGPEFYAVEYYDRPAYDGGVLVVENTGDLDWTHLINIQINGHYQIYDKEPFLAHTTKRYKLNKFWNRTGARFSLQYNQLERVRIYARRPSKDRATFYYEFPTVQE